MKTLVRMLVVVFLGAVALSACKTNTITSVTNNTTGAAGTGGTTISTAGDGAGGTSGATTSSSSVTDTTVGAICMTVTHGASVPLSGCTFDFLQIPAASEPAVSTTPPANCNAAGDYYFPAVKEGVYDVAVWCGAYVAQGKATIVAGAEQHLFWMLPEPVPTGQLCCTTNGLPIDLDTPTADMATCLGYGSGSTCVNATPAELSGMTVVEFTGPNCTQMTDPNCTIDVNGLVVSVLDFSGYAANELRSFKITVKDVNQKTVDVYIATLNGYFM